MNILCPLLSIAFSIWLLFFGGAEKLQDTIVGYLEFGWFADNLKYIRAIAWLNLAMSSVAVFV
jgi:hypothetical protein